MKTSQQLKDLTEKEKGITKEKLRIYLDQMVDLAIKKDRLMHLGGIVDIYLKCDYFKEHEADIHTYFKECGWKSEVVESTVTNEFAHYALSIKPI